MVDFITNGKEILHKQEGIEGFIITHYGDADSDEHATRIADALNHMSKNEINLTLKVDTSEFYALTSFNYVEEAKQTLSHEWHGKLVAKHVWVDAVNKAIDAINKLDKIKKTLFYGKHNYLTNGISTNIDEMPRNICTRGDEYNLITTTATADYIHGVLGAATECGELLEALRDVIDGKPFDPVNLKEEVGDIKWYLAILSTVGNFAWGEDEQANIAKLRARYPEKFTAWDATYRNLDSERAILENDYSYEDDRAANEALGVKDGVYNPVADSDGDDGA